MSVQRLMETAFDSKSHPTYKFEIQYFGAASGYELVSLDGIAMQAGTDSGEYLYWELAVNGVVADKGIDREILSDGDEVEWNFLAYGSAEPSQRRTAVRSIVSQSTPTTLGG
jgi:Domain of unknown function (DUF4430)